MIKKTQHQQRPSDTCCCIPNRITVTLIITMIIWKQKRIRKQQIRLMMQGLCYLALHQNLAHYQCFKLSPPPRQSYIVMLFLCFVLYIWNERIIIKKNSLFLCTYLQSVNRDLHGRIRKFRDRNKPCLDYTILYYYFIPRGVISSYSVAALLTFKYRPCGQWWLLCTYKRLP